MSYHKEIQITIGSPGSMLIEAMLALTVALICVVTIFQYQIVGIHLHEQARIRSELCNEALDTLEEFIHSDFSPRDSSRVNLSCKQQPIHVAVIYGDNQSATTHIVMLTIAQTVATYRDEIAVTLSRVCRWEGVL